MNHIPCTPQNTIILFDLHQVLFSHNYTQMLIECIKNIYLIRLLRPALIKKTINLLRRKGSGQELLVFIEQHYPHLAHTTAGIVAIANAQKLIPAMHTLVKELKTKGYEVHIASNIGETFFDDLYKRHTDFFALFDYIKIVTQQKNNVLIRKPMPAFFTNYQKEANPQNKNVIFIDDNKKHLHAARAHGFTPVLFKSSQQVRKIVLQKDPI